LLYIEYIEYIYTMETFYVIVMSIATIVLILALVLMGILMTSKGGKKDASFPPFVNSCPDYWKPVDNDISGNCYIPSYKPNGVSTNTGTLYKNVTTANGAKETKIEGNTIPNGNKTTPGYKYVDVSGNSTIDFSDLRWKSIAGSSICAQRAWANAYNVVWDGVTNYNSC